jgi:hypothetical protein
MARDEVLGRRMRMGGLGLPDDEVVERMYGLANYTQGHDDAVKNRCVAVTDAQWERVAARAARRRVSRSTVVRSALMVFFLLYGDAATT